MTRNEYDRLVDLLRTLLKESIYYFAEVRKDEAWKGRSGGYFCVADSITGTSLHPPVMIGEVSLDKAAKYLRFCIEKARRLAAHPEHVSSWDSRNPERDEWGGAVRVRDLIFSFSGVPEWGDEALTLMMAMQHYSAYYYVGSPTVEAQVKAILSRSGNPCFDQFQRFMSRIL